MHRIFIHSKDISGTKIILSDKDKLHHLRDVLRLKSGDKVIACDEKGNEYDCVVEELNEKRGRFYFSRELENAGKIETSPFLTIACALPKKAKFDELVDKLTQLGVNRIIPLLTERVIVKIDAKKSQAKLTRWKKIAQSASEQSQRSSLPQIEPIEKLSSLLSEIGKAGSSLPYELKLIPTLAGDRKSLSDIVSLRGAPPRAEAAKQFNNIIVLIGPEGDFSPNEISAAKKIGFIPVSLGDLVLRVDTAAIAIASFIKLNENY